MYNDYSNYQQSFDLPGDVSHVQNQSQWTGALRVNPSPVCQTQLREFSREFSDELAEKVKMHRMNKESMVGPSIDMMKKKFDSENMQLQKTSSSGSYSKSSQIINSTLEETYWAQWKPTPPNTSCTWTDMKQDSSIRGRSQFTACSTMNRRSADPMTSSEGRVKLLDEKSLKILRKPMDMKESNSSEGDKNIQSKLYLYNPCDDQISGSEIPPSIKNYPKQVPTFTMSMPNYHSVFYCDANDHKYQERVKPCRRREPKEQCCEREENIGSCSRNDKKREQDDDNQGGSSLSKNKGRNQEGNKRRPKSAEKKHDKFKGKSKQTKSDEEIPGADGELHKNRVRFFTKKHSDESNEDEETVTTSSIKDSSRTIDGYNGDVDTESYQVRDGGNICCDYDDSYEEGHGDLETDNFNQIQRKYVGYDHEEVMRNDMDPDTYGCHCPYYDPNYYLPNYRCFQSEEESYASKSDNGYRLYPHPHMNIYRSEDDMRYPNNNYNGDRDRSRERDVPTSSFYYNKIPQRESSFSSTSKSDRVGILKPRDPSRVVNTDKKCKMCCGKNDILLEKSCGTPALAPKTASCNTDAKICVNKSCETLGRITKEKKTGDDSPCCLKVIKEKPEIITNSAIAEVSSSSKSDECQHACKRRNEGRYHNSSTTTSTGTVSSGTSKSSTQSSKDTMAVAVDSSKDEIPDEESFATDEAEHKETDPDAQKRADKVNSPRPANPASSSGRSTNPTDSSGRSMYPTNSSVQSSDLNTTGSSNRDGADPLSTEPRGGAIDPPYSGSARKSIDDSVINPVPIMPNQGSATMNRDPDLYKAGPSGISSERDKADLSGRPSERDSGATKPGIAGRSFPQQRDSTLQENKSVGRSPGRLQDKTLGRPFPLEQDSTDNNTTPLVRYPERGGTPDKDPNILKSGPMARTLPLERDSDVHKIGPMRKLLNHDLYKPVPIRGTMDRTLENIRTASIGRPWETDRSGYNNEKTPIRSGSVRNGPTQNVPTQTGPVQKSGANRDGQIFQNDVTQKAPVQNDLPQNGSIATSPIQSGPANPDGKSDNNIGRMRYGTYRNPGSKLETPGERKVGTPFTREASIDDNTLHHGRSFDGIRHYRSQENALVFQVGTTEKDLQPPTPRTDGLKDAKEYSTLSGPFIIMSTEARNSAPAVVTKPLILQRSPRYQVQTRPGLKGHTYTLKTPPSAGRTGRSPKRKR